MQRTIFILAFVAVALAVGTPAHAQSKPRVLVLPLTPSSAVNSDVARAFDARLLVALDETRRLVTLTPADEPECTTMQCLAALAQAVNASHVLTLAVVREDGGLTLFGTLVDAATASTARRAELTRLSAADLARTAPAELARQIAGGGRTGPGVVGVALPAVAGNARNAALAVADRLAALRTFGVVAIDKRTDRSSLTHRAEVTLTTLQIEQRVHHVRRYLDGVLVGTLAITDLSDGSTLYSRTVRVTVSRRFRYSTRAEVAALLVEAAVQDWMSGFHIEKIEARLTKGE